jgi:hypothetical protein
MQYRKDLLANAIDQPNQNDPADIIGLPRYRRQSAQANAMAIPGSIPMKKRLLKGIGDEPCNHITRDRNRKKKPSGAFARKHGIQSDALLSGRPAYPNESQSGDNKPKGKNSPKTLTRAPK